MGEEEDGKEAYQDGDQTSEPSMLESQDEEQK